MIFIERDWGEGHPSLACPAGAPGPDCFPDPARVKRVVLADLSQLDGEGIARRLGWIDLLDIADPDGLARLDTDAEGIEGRFAMPFTTIEGVRPAGRERLMVSIDNNLPVSAGRRLDYVDQSETVLIEAPAFLAAR